jgi:hypothetical protein
MKLQLQVIENKSREILLPLNYSWSTEDTKGLIVALFNDSNVPIACARFLKRSNDNKVEVGSFHGSEICRPLLNLEATWLTEVLAMPRRHWSTHSMPRSESFHRDYQLEFALLKLKLFEHQVPFEAIPFQIDNVALWNEIEPLTKAHPSYQRSASYGGWTLQASDAAIAHGEQLLHDGWPMEFCPYNGPDNRGPTWTPLDNRERQMRTIQSYRNPTAFCTPKILALLNRLEAAGLSPRRARLSRIGPRYPVRWHQDGSSKIYQVRLHIPLLTNKDCYFESELGKVHMPLDGQAYFVHINRPHRAVNDSDEDRYHIVIHVWDRLGVTRHHRFDWTLFDVETHHDGQVDLQEQWGLKNNLVSPSKN